MMFLAVLEFLIVIMDSSKDKNNQYYSEPIPTFIRNEAMPENLSKLPPSLPMKNENILNNSSTPTGTSMFDNSDSFGEAIQGSETKKKVTLTKYYIFQLLTTNKTQTL